MVRITVPSYVFSSRKCTTEHWKMNAGRRWTSWASPKKPKSRPRICLYGEKRELEIALALSLQPQVLLLDEPFAGLSLVDIAHISQVINSIKGQFTIVIIEHKISKLMDLVDSLCVINEGRMICNGDPQKVICDPEVRECYWGKEEMGCY